jgi:hypothetical protein
MPLAVLVTRHPQRQAKVMTVAQVSLVETTTAAEAEVHPQQAETATALAERAVMDRLIALLDRQLHTLAAAVVADTARQAALAEQVAVVQVDKAVTLKTAQTGQLILAAAVVVDTTVETVVQVL